MNDFTHFDDSGAARMVDVGKKQITQRIAKASCMVRMGQETMRQIRQGTVHKGDVLQVARLAGIMAAKKTSDLIPLCHPLPLDAISVTFEFSESDLLTVRTEVCTTGRTGVEMEALVAASVTALTVYDMCKSVDREMTIENVRLNEKHGGKSGHFRRSKDA